MPDPDIPPIVLTDEEIAAIQADLPMLPPEYRAKWASIGLDQSVIDALLARPAYARLITDIQQQSGDNTARRVAHWFSSALSRRDEEPVAEEAGLSPERFIELAGMVDANELSSTAAKEIFIELLSSDVSARQVAEDKNLLQVSDEGVVAAVVDEVLADPANAKAVADIKDGNEKVIGFLVGQVMKKSQGKANPALAQKLIRERL